MGDHSPLNGVVEVVVRLNVVYFDLLHTLICSFTFVKRQLTSLDMNVEIKYIEGHPVYSIGNPDHHSD